jgi:hypothetical protein
VRATWGTQLTGIPIIQLATLGSVVIVIVALAALFARSAIAAVWTLVAVFVVSEAIVPPVGLQVTAGGVTVYAMDVVVTVMFAIGLWRLVTRSNPPEIVLPLALLSGLLAMHMLWGVASFGLQTGVNGSRSWLFVIGTLVFASQAEPAWTRRSFTPLIAAATALSIVALVSIAHYGLHPANDYIMVRGEFVDARPVAAKGSLLMVQCLLLLPVVRPVRPPFLWLAFGSMALAIALLQYRTVWIVAIVVVTIAYLRWARVAIFTNQRAALTAASIVLVLAPVAAGFTVSSSAFGQSVNSATEQDSTLQWRWKSWTSLLAQHSSAQDRVLGLPAGSPLERRIGNTVSTVSPHDLFVDALLTLGVLGVLALGYLFVGIVRRRHRVALALAIPSGLVVVLVFSQLIFGITEMLDPVQGVLLGMLLQAAHGARSQLPVARAA